MVTINDQSLGNDGDTDTNSITVCPIILPNIFPELTPDYPMCPLISHSTSSPITSFPAFRSAPRKFKLHSTEEMYMISNKQEPPLFYGPFANQKKRLDYDYHRVYRRDRQALQDKILQKALSNVKIIDHENGNVCCRPTKPFIVFTAGAMGAGKSHTIQTLQLRNLFPLSAFVRVDPDNLRTQLPEFHSYYNRIHPIQAGEMTRKEAGHLVELLTLISLDHGMNVLVDGTLQDWIWYKQYFQYLRKNYPNIQIAILHVVAPKSTIYHRVKERGKITGRFVPEQTLCKAIRQVPISMEHLSQDADFFCTLYNPPDADGDLEIRTEGVCWENFKCWWKQT